MLEPTRRAASRVRAAEQYWQRARPPYAVGESYRASYSAVGKASDRGKVSTAARRPARPRIPDRSDRSSMRPPPCGPEQTRQERATVLPGAEASATEEPEAGKLHVRVCTGGAG